VVDVGGCGGRGVEVELAGRVEMFLKG